MYNNRQQIVVSGIWANKHSEVGV